MQAKSRGWVAFDGSLRLQEIRDGFVRHYGKVLDYLGDDLFGELANANAGCLAYLFRNTPSRRHPSKHVALSGFLFGNFAEFENMVERVRIVLEQEGQNGCEALLRDQRSKLIRLVKEEGLSLSKAAPEVGTTASIAAKFIDRHHNIARDRRPRIVGTEKERRLRELLDEGTSREEIAHQVGIRRAFIKDYLAEQPDQKSRWEKAHFERQKEDHRSRFLTTLSENPGLPIKTIRLLPRNGFQWLYNNDRVWLREVLPALWKR